MNKTKKEQFDPNKAFEACVMYYQRRGYSEQHSRAYVASIPEWDLQNVYEQICEEQQNNKNEVCTDANISLIQLINTRSKV